MKRFLLAYFFATLFFLTFFSSGFMDSQDGMQYLAVARRMYYDHSFEMPDEDYPLDNIHMSITKSKDGKRYSPTGLGYSLALLPAVAIEDAFNRAANVAPTTAFPLENDWPVLLFASMTNAIFGALFVITLYAYLRSFEVDHWPSVAYSLIGLMATNIFPYTKHTFAHMMFVSFMTLSFYFLKKFGLTKKRGYLALAAASYGVVVLAYNPTYLLPLPAIGIYYFLQRFDSIKKAVYNGLSSLKKILLDFTTAVISISPFVSLYWWFNSVRFSGGLQTGYGTRGIPLPTIPEAYVFVEGFWGLLFSPGKSIFLFTPLLILLVIFWFKIKKRWFKECIAGSILFFTYFYFMGTLLGGEDFLLWHGEASWGPRYILPVIPLLYIVIVGIATKLSRTQKWLVFMPLVLFGLIVQLTGMLIPYQTRFAGLETDVQFNGRNHTVYEYGNQIPRYSPFFNQFKRLVRKVKDYPKQLDHGQYNLVLKDGFARPFHIWENAWREPLGVSSISFESQEQNPVQNIELRFRNHQMQPIGTASAHLNFKINGDLIQDSLVIESDKEEVINLNLNKSVRAGNNELLILKEFVGEGHTKKTQVLFLQSVHINQKPFWLGTVDYPYVSLVSEGLFEANYHYFGNIEKTPWELWHMHSGIYEEGFDLWWLRPLHVWDFPKGWFFTGFAFTVIGWIASSLLMILFSQYSE